MCSLGNRRRGGGFKSRVFVRFLRLAERGLRRFDQNTEIACAQGTISADALMCSCSVNVALTQFVVEDFENLSFVGR